MKKAKLKEKLTKKREKLRKTEKMLAKTRSKLKDLQKIVDAATGVEKAKFPGPITSEADADAAAVLAVKGASAGQNGQ